MSRRAASPISDGADASHDESRSPRATSVTLPQGVLTETIGWILLLSDCVAA